MKFNELNIHLRRLLFGLLVLFVLIGIPLAGLTMLAFIFKVSWKLGLCVVTLAIMFGVAYVIGKEEISV